MPFGAGGVRRACPSLVFLLRLGGPSEPPSDLSLIQPQHLPVAADHDYVATRLGEHGELVQRVDGGAVVVGQVEGGPARVSLA